MGKPSYRRLCVQKSNESATPRKQVAGRAGQNGRMAATSTNPSHSASLRASVLILKAVQQILLQVAVAAEQDPALGSCRADDDL